MPVSKKSEKSGLPSVSVIVCTLNEEKRIANCLSHLSKQDYAGPIELIVADGHSEDKTVSIAKKFKAKIVLEKKRSIACERQAGAKTATGELLLFTDADSSAPTNWVSHVVKTFQKNPDAAFVYGPVFPNDAHGLDRRLPQIFMPIFLSVFHFLHLNSPIGSNIAVPARVFHKVGGFNLRMITCEDLDLAKRSRKEGRLVLDMGMKMYVSQRRIKAWGLWKYVTFHVFNGINFHLFGKARRDYEDIR